MGRTPKSEAVGNTLVWSVEEIVMHYRQAADKYTIIGILADLNNVDRAKIRSVLKTAGITPPGKRTKKQQPFLRNHYYLVSADGGDTRRASLPEKRGMRSPTSGTKRTRAARSRLTARCIG